ncbi:MAG: hypothetical protein C0502_01515 [Opitutus sp.]|nr:hypothetical protein [Opitutus sp.]
MHIFSWGRIVALACSLGVSANEGLAMDRRLSAEEKRQGYSNRTVLAKPRSDLSVADVAAAERREGRRPLREYPRLGGLRLLAIRQGENLSDMVADLRSTGRYEFVEHDYIKRRHLQPNDPKFLNGDTWHLRNTGQDGGVAGADIRATAGWDIRTSATDVIVAVIDTGIRRTHEELRNNLWINPGEIAGNGIDDDNNGYVDDVHGINTLAAPSSAAGGDPLDDDGHGTSVAGLIGAAGNNGLGIAGVAWSVRIMALKFDDAEGSSTTSDEIECIDYAISKQAKVINFSYGSNGFSQSEMEAIQRARDSGIIFVASAGNDSVNLDLRPDYPGSLVLDNIVVVGATDRRDSLSSFSSYSSGLVELAAPGSEIATLSSSADTAYRTIDGTSFSAPLAAGTLALLRSAHPSESHRQLINRLLRGADRIPALSGKVQTGGRLSLAGALGSSSNRPFNDEFSNAAMLAGELLNIRANMDGATSESNEPSHAGISTAGSIWWSWTAPRNGSVTVETVGSTLDTVLAVYNGPTLGTLSTIASNDDVSAAATSSRVGFSVTAGATYRIAVAGKSGTAGGVHLTLGYQPANDAFSAATNLTGKSIRVSGINAVSTSENSEPTAATGTQGRSVWFRWTAPTTSDYSLSVFAFGFNAVAAVYTGNTLGDLAKLDTASEEVYNESAYIEAVAGRTYFIQVDSLDIRTGYFDLTLLEGVALPGYFPYHPSVTFNPAARRLISADTYGTMLFINDETGELDYDILDGTLDVQTPAAGLDGAVYIGDDYGYFQAYNTSAARAWQKDFGYVSILSSPAIGSDGAIYVHSDDGRMHAYYPDGTLKWRSSVVPGDSYSSPSIADNGTIYIGSSDQHLYALSPVDGTIRWRFRADGEIYSSPAIDGSGSVYFGTLNGKFYSVNQEGAQRWSYTAGGGISSSPAIASDGTVYFGSYDTYLHALSSNGQLLWRYATGDEIRGSSPAIASDGTVYIGSYDGYLHAVSRNGTPRQTYATGGRIRNSPLINDGYVWFGSGDSKLYGAYIGMDAAPSPWPMHRQNVRRTGRRLLSVAPAVSMAPASVSAVLDAPAAVGVEVQGPENMTFQWSRNGVNLNGQTRSTVTFERLTTQNAGVYSVAVDSPLGPVSGGAAIVGPTITAKVNGRGTEVGQNILHPNGNIFDQILLEGDAASFTADAGQITRLSYIDANDDIVQVEFSGAGTVSILLDSATPPAPPVKYNQAVNYVKGQATIVVVGADETTNLSVFSVGKATAVNQALFKADTAYDGRADIACVAIQSPTGRFGGLRTANTRFTATRGLTGVYAPGVNFSGPVFVGDIAASDNASPVLRLGSAGDVRIAGGELLQPNSRAVQVSGITQLRFTAGGDSHGNLLPAKNNRARLEESGIDVTSRIVVNPAG